MKLSGIDKDFKPEGPGPGREGPARPASRPASSATSPSTSRSPRRTASPPTQDQERAAGRAVPRLQRDRDHVDHRPQRERLGHRRVPPPARLRRPDRPPRGSRGTSRPRAASTRSARRSARWPRNPLRRGGPMLRVIGIKTFLDGGMLTGSAYMRQPWGVSRIYAIDDPDYRGVLFIPPEQLVADRPRRRWRPASSSRRTASATAPCTTCSTPTRRSTARRRSPRPARASPIPTS